MLLSLSIQLAQAHGGVSIDIDKCKFQVANYNLHYASYLPNDIGGEEFCWDVPKSGQVFLTLDFINNALKTKETSFDLYKKSTDKLQVDQQPIASIPFSYHRSGNMNLEANLEKGSYVGVLSIKDGHETHRANISINIGLDRQQNFLPMLALVLFSIGLLAYFILKKNKQSQ